MTILHYHGLFWSFDFWLLGTNDKLSRSHKLTSHKCTTPIDFYQMGAAVATVKPLATLRPVQWCAATGRGHIRRLEVRLVRAPMVLSPRLSCRPYRGIVVPFTSVYKVQTADGEKKRYKRLVICHSVSRLHDLVWAPCSGDSRIRVHDVGPMSHLSV